MTGNTTATYGSLTFGAVDANSVSWTLTSLQGWGSPKSSIKVASNVRQPGAWAGDGYLTERYLTVNLTLSAPSPEALNTALDSLYQTVQMAPSMLTVTQSGVARSMMVRRAAADMVEGRVSSVFATPSFQVVALDGRKLGVPLTGTTGVASTTGGLTVPFTVPVSINATVQSGTIGMTSLGNTDGPVTLLIHGPLSGPSVAHVNSGLTLTFASSLTLGASEFLLVDMDAHTALAQGQAPRSQFITSRQWFSLQPGDNEFQFTASSASPGCYLTVTATPAWQ